MLHALVIVVMLPTGPETVTSGVYSSEKACIEGAEMESAKIPVHTIWFCLPKDMFDGTPRDQNEL